MKNPSLCKFITCASQQCQKRFTNDAAIVSGTNHIGLQVLAMEYAKTFQTFIENLLLTTTFLVPESQQ